MGCFGCKPDPGSGCPELGPGARWSRWTRVKQSVEKKLSKHRSSCQCALHITAGTDAVHSLHPPHKHHPGPSPAWRTVLGCFLSVSAGGWGTKREARPSLCPLGAPLATAGSSQMSAEMHWESVNSRCSDITALRLHRALHPDLWVNAQEEVCAFQG